MRYIWILAVVTLQSIWGASQPQDQVCKRCHPAIFKEYYGSAHRKASLSNDAVHRAVWERHPMRKSGKYGCKKCHSPSDDVTMGKEGDPLESRIQKEEPISCVYCHSIKDVQKHAKANTNVLVDSDAKRPLLFSADAKRKGEKVVFKEVRGFLGLTKKSVGSPYHDLDFGNDAYYSGKICLGCHEHKQNAKGFEVCTMDLRETKNGRNCIGCHMPQVPGSATTIRKTSTHAYHGMGTHESLKLLEKYISLAIEPKENGFELVIGNEANHMLLMHPLRMAEVKVVLRKKGQQKALKGETFRRVIGKEGKPAMPWLADTVVSDTMLKAGETRKIFYPVHLEKGDSLDVTITYFRVAPAAARKLGLQNTKASEEKVLKRAHFTF